MAVCKPKCCPVHCSARSPDLTCHDYFLRGYLKSLVFQIPISSDEDLVTCILATVGKVRNTSKNLAMVRSPMCRRCGVDVCIRARGHYLKHIL
ncbi:uncharacterized protein TNCV_400701 [Trichonephila clavipes]|nr:uncharacterized protein TNCV_400701 [Trichonephila clavipes]